MKNYHFNLVVAKKVPLRTLFTMLLGLIEVQRKASLYRAGVHTDLNQFGICNNLAQVVKVGTSNCLPNLFFKGASYPILPYWMSVCGSDEIRKARWGNNTAGNTRIKMLDHMIKDLTNYLTNDAII